MPARPTPPALLPVEWAERDGGLWLSPEAYRALETNIIRMRAYQTQLEAYADALEEIIARLAGDQ